MTNIIEFIGRPASGKSTISSEIIKVSTESDLSKLDTAYSRTIAEVYNIPSFVAQFFPHLPDYVINKIAMFGGWKNHSNISFQHRYNNCYKEIVEGIERYYSGTDMQERVSGSFLELEGKYWTVKSRYDGDGVLIEEGFVHKAMLMFCRSNQWDEKNFDVVEKYIETIPQPDLVIILDIDPATRAERKKQDPNRPDDTVKISPDIYQRQKKLIDYVERAACGLRNTEVIRVDNSGTKKNTIEKILQSPKFTDNI